MHMTRVSSSYNRFLACLASHLHVCVLSFIRLSWFADRGYELRMLALRLRTPKPIRCYPSGSGVSFPWQQVPVCEQNNALLTRSI
jgi:hypothetical protein